MKKYKQFDIADEIFTTKEETSFLIRKQVKANRCKLIETTIKDDNNPYGKKKGLYTTIEFLNLNEEQTYLEVKKIMVKYLSSFIKNITKKKNISVLIVGLGNEEFSPDALGPKVIKKVIPTSHLKDNKSNISCIIPGVMGITGVESFTIVKGLINELEFDLIIVIDALTTHSILRLNHCIQITDTGLVPGSGVNNKRKEFSKEKLKLPIISIGIATVISLESIYQELLNSLNINKKINLKTNDNIMLTSKEIEQRIDILTALIADSINTIFKT